MYIGWIPRVVAKGAKGVRVRVRVSPNPSLNSFDMDIRRPLAWLCFSLSY